MAAFETPGGGGRGMVLCNHMLLTIPCIDPLSSWPIVILISPESGISIFTPGKSWQTNEGNLQETKYSLQL